MNYMDDVFFIFVAHVICTVLWFVKKLLKTSRFYGAYVKVFLSNTCILLYVASFIYVYYQQMLYQKDDQIAQLDADVKECLSKNSQKW